MKKTIWIINEYAGSPYHGMVYRHYYLGKYLTRLGYKIYIITAAYSHNYYNIPKVNKNFEIQNIDGIDYVWVKVPKYNNAHDKKRVWKWFIFTMKTYFMLPHQILLKPDLILVSSPSPFPIIAGYKWAKKYRAKLFFEVRDIWPLSLIEIGKISAKHPFILFVQVIEKFSYKKSDKILSVLPLAYKHIEKYEIPKEKIIYLPNGIDVEEFNNLESISSNILKNIPEDNFIVGYTGTLGESNALEYLIKAAEILKDYKDIHFLIVGKGKNEKNLKKLTKDLGLKNVTFLGPVKKTQILEILKMVDVCYIGLKKEPLLRYGVSPNKLYDYMYSGKPILYAINSGNKPIDDANCGITVDAENPKAIAEGIYKLYKMPKEKRKKLGENGKNYILKYHSYKMIADKFNELLCEKCNI